MEVLRAGAHKVVYGQGDTGQAPTASASEDKGGKGHEERLSYGEILSLFCHKWGSLRALIFSDEQVWGNNRGEVLKGRDASLHLGLLPLTSELFTSSCHSWVPKEGRQSPPPGL